MSSLCDLLPVRLYKEPTRPTLTALAKYKLPFHLCRKQQTQEASRQRDRADSGPPVVRRSRASIGGTGGQGLVRQGPERPRCGAALTDMLMPRRGCGALWEGLRSGRGP